MSSIDLPETINLTRHITYSPDQIQHIEQGISLQKLSSSIHDKIYYLKSKKNTSCCFYECMFCHVRFLLDTLKHFEQSTKSR